MKKNSKQQNKQLSKRQQSKQHSKRQQSKQHSNQQRATSKPQPGKRATVSEEPTGGKRQTRFEQQMKKERQHMQQSDEIGGVAGIDIGDKRSYLRLVALDGSPIEEMQIATRAPAIESFFCRWPRLRVVLETGTHSNWMRRLIAELDHEVVVADARQLRLISDSYAKNDRNDAYWLAELGRTNPALLTPVPCRDQQIEQHRSWLRGRQALVETRTKLLLSLRGIAKSHGIRLAKCGMTQWSRQVQEQCPAVLREILEPLARSIAALSQQIGALDRRIEKLGQQHYSSTELLRTADGVGPLTSLAYVLELNNQARSVKHSRDMGAVVGCRPKQRESGQSAPQLGITKKGNSLLRQLLVQSAQRILGPFGQDSALRRWGLALAARGGKRAKRRAVVAVARKLAVILHAMWVHQQVWQPFPEGEPVATTAG